MFSHSRIVSPPSVWAGAVAVWSSVAESRSSSSRSSVAESRSSRSCSFEGLSRLTSLSSFVGARFGVGGSRFCGGCKNVVLFEQAAPAARLDALTACYREFYADARERACADARQLADWETAWTSRIPKPRVTGLETNKQNTQRRV